MPADGIAPPPESVLEGTAEGIVRERAVRAGAGDAHELVQVVERVSRGVPGVGGRLHVVVDV